ncbi:STM4015 family protein [Trichocoleus sp. FACHB-591]|uniref:STM4015 family protein n=1 Tax=Trichocoleus sp. FACHB-591 TaxID=2692872 RepID=UPI001686305E|nr:STM4015 family protein [Trichocoleus sp. FACHB-591]MBD2096391.1 STM4015 family protein [Trichocoleus sp. FACHB-591]
MTHSNSDPHDSDAVLGGNNPAPRQGAILGGIQGILQKLSNPDLTIRLEALDQAWSYGEAGRVCLEQALGDHSKTVRRRARWLLRQPKNTEALLLPRPLWNLNERLIASVSDHVTRFANRTVHEEFVPGDSLQNPSQFAYAFRCDYDYSTDDMFDRLNTLLNTPGSEQIESLVFGMWDDGESVCTGDASSQRFVEQLVSLRDRLPNLKALFIGDILGEECEISWLQQSDMSPLLQAYPHLEMLQVRGGMGLEFVPPENALHEHLKALILETGGLSRETVLQIYEWDLPALEHLEFWFGSEYYGGNCWEQDLSPILDDLIFPNLTYLGLRNSQFADDLIDRLVRSPLLPGLQVLDLSLGTLSDEGAAKLLEYDAIRDLEILNVSASYLSGAMIDQLQPSGIQVIADDQRTIDEEYEDERYCAVSE